MPKQFKSKRSNLPPLEFEIEYERLLNGEWTEQTDKFMANGMVPGGVMLELAAAMEKPVGVQSEELIGLLNAAIVREDRIRFMQLIKDPDATIAIETLGEILEWLAEEYGNRPT